MAQNPLLGSRISLISKKNIRYEGTLYSINETNATVALQSVRSYGTEGREKLDPTCVFVGPQDSVHPYLLFRGCDIKDLHVHENAASQPPSDPAIMSTDAPPAASQQSTRPAPPVVAQSAQSKANYEEEKKQAKDDQTASEPVASKGAAGGEAKPYKQGGKGNKQKNANSRNQVGTGASLLNRKVRGTKDGGLAETPAEEFDFQSKLKEFDKGHEEGDDEAGDSPQPPTVGYAKDDFFDSISCDVLDREAGIDNRLRGAAERNLNTETFGAVALNSQRRHRRYRGGDGGGRDGGRSGGQRDGGGGRGGRARGRGRGGRGRGGRGRGRGRSNSDD